MSLAIYIYIYIYTIYMRVIYITEAVAQQIKSESFDKSFAC